MPKNYKINAKTAEIQSAIFQLLDEPKPFAYIDFKLDLGKSKTSYYLKKMVCSGTITMTKIQGAPSYDAFIYSIGNGVEQVKGIPRTYNKTIMTLAELKEKEGREYKPKGAMAKVENAFQKLAEVSRITHQDRNTAYRKAKANLGISPVYNG